MALRVALEQLLFSHRSPARAGGPPLYRSIRNRRLLVAGEADDDQTLEIHDASLSMARQMPDTPGEAVFLRDTGHSIHDERPRWLADRMVAFLGNEGRGGPLAEAGWVHGHDLEVEHLDRILEIIRVGSTGAVRGRGGQSTWLHLAVPTPVIADGRRLRAGSVLLRFRTDADDTRIRAAHVYDGENRIGALNGLAETSRG